MEAKYAALSACLRDVIPVINLVNEISRIVDMPEIKLVIKITVFEDYEGTIKVVKAPSLTLRTKHIVLKMHHFRSYIASGQIEIESINMLE